MSEDVHTRTKDGRGWRIGTFQDIAWITSAPGLTITAAIPPVFAEVRDADATERAGSIARPGR